MKKNILHGQGKHVLPFVLFALMLALAGCRDGGKQAGEPTDAGKPPVAVEILPVQARDLVEAIEVTGSLEPKFAADVKSQIPGLFREVYVTDWVRVKEGDPLARIDVAETEAAVKRAEAAMGMAKAELARSRAAEAAANRELARMQELFADDLATQQSLDNAKTEQEASRARTHAVEAQIRAAEQETRQAGARLTKGLIRSPMDGVVSLRAVNVGDFASDAAAAKPIFRIVDNRILNLTVTVPAADSGRVAVGQSLEFSVDAFPGKTFTATLMFLNPEYNQADRSLKVVSEVANDPELLKGGLFVKGRIVTNRRTGVLQAPRTALSAWDTATDRANVFVVSNNTAKLRKVATGKVADDLVEITEGLSAGEAIIIRGGFTVKDGDTVAVTGGGPRL